MVPISSRGGAAQGYSCLWNSSSLTSPAASASIIRVYRNNNSHSEWSHNAIKKRLARGGDAVMRR